MKSERVSWLTKPRVRWGLFLVVMSGLAGMSQPVHAKRTAPYTASVSSAKQDTQAQAPGKSRDASVGRSAGKFCQEWLEAGWKKVEAFIGAIFSPVRWLFEWVCGILPQPWATALRRVVRKIGEHGKLILFVGLALLSAWAWRRKAALRGVSKQDRDPQAVAQLLDAELIHRILSDPSSVSAEQKAAAIAEAKRRTADSKRTEEERNALLMAVGQVAPVLVPVDGGNQDEESDDELPGTEEVGKLLQQPTEVDAAEVQYTVLAAQSMASEARRNASMNQALVQADGAKQSGGNGAEAVQQAQKERADTILKELDAALQAKQGRLKVTAVVGEKYDRPLQEARCALAYWDGELKDVEGKYTTDYVARGIEERLEALKPVLSQAAKDWEEAHEAKLEQEVTAAGEDLGKRVELYSKALGELQEVAAWMPPRIWDVRYEKSLLKKKSLAEDALAKQKKAAAAEKAVNKRNAAAAKESKDGGLENNPSAEKENKSGDDDWRAADFGF